MAGTTLAQVCRFVRESLPGSEDDGDCATLANLGQLPLVRLLQLRAFLALHASRVYLPSGLDSVPETQASQARARRSLGGGHCSTARTKGLHSDQFPALQPAHAEPGRTLFPGMLPFPSAASCAPATPCLLQDSLTLLPAEVTPTGGVRLTPAGLATLEAEAHALQVRLSQSRQRSAVR